MRDPREIDAEILDHGPSEQTVAVILRKMKDEGRLTDVVQAGARFLTQYPDNLHLRSLMVESYLKMGFVGRALDELEKLSALIKELMDPYKSVAEYFAGQQRWEAALRPLRFYRFHHPEDTHAAELMKRIEARMATSQEEDEMLAVEFATPTIAELYYEQGQLDAAIKTYQKVLEKEPENPSIRQRLEALKQESVHEIAPHAPVLSPQQSSSQRLNAILQRWRLKVREIRYAE